MTGNSITDCGRDRENKHSLSGYNAMIAEYYQSAGIECFNRGISGERSKNLLARISGELEEIQPDLVFILIGINDTWRRYDENDPTTAEQFENNYRQVLEIIRSYGAKIVILEPFLLPVEPSRMVFREDLNFKIDVARALARDYAEAYVPLDGLFAKEVLNTEPALLSFDGVHPTELGNRKIAEWWMRRATLQV